MSRTLTGALLLSFSLSLSWNAAAGERARETATVLDGIERSLRRLAGHEHAEAASGEIDLAEKWTAEAREALGEGRDRRAAILAERLEPQLDLVRAVLDAAGIAAEAERAELELAELEAELNRLRDMIARLTIAREGVRLTDAYPRGEEDGEQ
ncbi:MAG: hypothetical protein R6V85_03260 [Polyangia bacterium]